MSGELLNMAAALDDLRARLIWLTVSMTALWCAVLIGGVILADIRRALRTQEDARANNRRRRL